MSSNRLRKTYKFFQGFGDEPKFEDFGITAEEYDKFSKGHNPWNTPMQAIAFVIAVITGVVIGSTAEESFDGLTFGFVVWIGLALVAGAISEFLTRRSPLYRKSKLYKEALATFYQTKEKYWLSLRGEGLEYILADLYRKLGCKVGHTPRTNDKGIDLILKKGNITTIVQSKGYKNPVGPAIVRELYGTLKFANAESAILVSPAGFTKGAKQTAAGKDIQLISSYELIAMAKELE